jgi:hypothetical protein
VTRDEGAKLSYDELDAAGYCECGQALATHPRLKRPPPMTRCSRSPWLPVDGRAVAPGRRGSTETGDQSSAAAGVRRSVIHVQPASQ